MLGLTWGRGAPGASPGSLKCKLRQLVVFFDFATENSFFFFLIISSNAVLLAYTCRQGFVELLEALCPAEQSCFHPRTRSASQRALRAVLEKVPAHPAVLWAAPCGLFVVIFERFGNPRFWWAGGWVFPRCNYSSKQFLDISHLMFATKEACSAQRQESCLSVRKYNADYRCFCGSVSRIDFCGWEQREERSWEPAAAI